MKQLFLIMRVFLQFLLIATLIIFFVFFGMRMMDYWETPDGEVQPIALAQQSWSETTDYITNLFQGNMGVVTLVYGEEQVSDVLWEWFKNSMGLIAISLTLATTLGILMGLSASLAKNQWQTYVVLFLTMLGLSAPVFLVAVLLQTLGIRYSVTFGSRLVSMGGFAWDVEHLLMPVLALMARPLAQITRATYISLREILKEDYIRTAYSKGLRQERVIYIHAFRNLAIPLLTAIGVSFRFVVGVLPIVEYIFGWPGVGLNALIAVQERIPILFIAIALLLGLTIQLINATLGGLNRLADPRLREAS